MTTHTDTDTDTDTGTETNRLSKADSWPEAFGRFATFHVATALGMTLALVFRTWTLFADYQITEITTDPGQFTGVFALALVGAIVASPIVYVAYRYLPHRSDRNPLFVLLGLCGAVSGVFVLHHFVQEILSGGFNAELFLEMELTAILTVLAGITLTLALLVLPGELANRYLTSRLTFRSRRGVGVVLVVLVLFATPVVGGSVAPDTFGVETTQTDDSGDYIDVSVTNESAYDDGNYGPTIDGDDERVSTGDYAPANRILQCSASGDESTPTLSSDSEYNPAAVHHSSEHIELARYTVETESGEFTPDGRYALRLTGPAEEGTVILRGAYGASFPADGGWDTAQYSVPRHGLGTLAMEGVESMTVSYDVVNEDGEIHRYTTRVCR